MQWFIVCMRARKIKNLQYLTNECVYLLWFNFFFGFNFLLCFKFIMIHNYYMAMSQED